MISFLNSKRDDILKFLSLTNLSQLQIVFSRIDARDIKSFFCLFLIVGQLTSFI